MHYDLMFLNSRHAHLGRTPMGMVPGVILYPDQLLLHLHLPGQLTPHLLHRLIELLQLLLVHLDPLAAVADCGVLQQGTKHHTEAEGKIYIKSLHVRNLWQGAEERIMKPTAFYSNVLPVDGSHECNHSEDSGHPQPHPGRGGAPVQVEADPGHDHYQAAWNIDLDDVVAHASTEQNVSTQSGVVATCQLLQHPPLPVADNIELCQ